MERKGPAFARIVCRELWLCRREGRRASFFFAFFTIFALNVDVADT
jgi:hypothetical protein